MQRNEVNVAFELLLEEIESVVNTLHEDGAAAFKSGNYDAARRAIEQAARLAEYREKVKALQKEWAVLAGQAPPGKKQRRRSVKERLRRGLRTPEDAFRRPILEALVECGGRAPMGKVLEAVEKKMRNRLTEYDFLPLSSDPRSVRWRNTAQWCRNSLVREGLLKRDSPHGIWEISESGRKTLEQEAS